VDEKRFRFDLFVAVCALLLSGIAAGAAAYQTYVINQQFSATVWPYLSEETSYAPGQFSIVISNDGLGPAIVKSADLTIGNRTYERWFDLAASMPHGRHASIGGRFSSVYPGDVIRSGGSKTLIDLKGNAGFPNGIQQWLDRRHATLNVCYCSVLQRCWKVRLLGEDASPQDVPSCGPPHKIAY